MSARTIGRHPDRRRVAGLLLAGLAMAMSGCGRKPGGVDPAEDAGPEAALYPRQYPNLKYDPTKTVPPSQAVVPPAPETGAATAPANTKAAPVPPPAPAAYPKIIRPEDLTPNAVLGSTGSWVNQ